jgi:hypothetical protein
LGEPTATVEQHTIGIGDRDEQARAHHGTGHGYQQFGDPARAQEELHQALSLYRELGLPQADQVRADLDALGSYQI